MSSNQIISTVRIAINIDNILLNVSPIGASLRLFRVFVDVESNFLSDHRLRICGKLRQESALSAQQFKSTHIYNWKR
jgi:hypothetical protein